MALNISVKNVVSIKLAIHKGCKIELLNGSCFTHLKRRIRIKNRIIIPLKRNLFPLSSLIYPPLTYQLVEIRVYTKWHSLCLTSYGLLSADEQTIVNLNTRRITDEAIKSMFMDWDFFDRLDEQCMYLWKCYCHPPADL